jgi:hypothetical protein
LKAMKWKLEKVWSLQPNGGSWCSQIFSQFKTIWAQRSDSGGES